jgi:hypothetical protein
MVLLLTQVGWPNGKALDYESRDCRFDPCVDQREKIVQGVFILHRFKTFVPDVDILRYRKVDIDHNGRHTKGFFPVAGLPASIETIAGSHESYDGVAATIFIVLQRSQSS